jgi:hypothetical protein
MMDTGQCSPRHAGTNGPSSYIPQRPDARWDRVFLAVIVPDVAIGPLRLELMLVTTFVVVNHFD